MSNSTSNPESQQRKRILLIEDDAIARLQLLQRLRGAGFDVDIATNGQVALERIRAAAPDVILMDLLIPAVNGVDVIKAARRHPTFKARPIYVCTTAAMLETWSRRATSAGATRVYDRAVTPVDVLVAEIAADLGVTHPEAASPPATAPGDSPAEPKAAAAVDTRRQAPPPPTAPQPFLQRVLGSFKSGKRPQPTVPAPAQPKAATPPMTPATALAASALPEAAPSSLVASLPTNVPEGFVQSASVETLPPAPVAAELEPASRASVPNRVPTMPPPQPIPAAFIPIPPPPAPTPPPPATFSPSAPPAPPVLVAPPAPAIQYGQPAIVSFDESGTIVSANEACATIFGWEGTSLLGQNLGTLLRDGNDHEILRFVKGRLGGNDGETRTDVSVIARRKDGAEFPASVSTLIWSTETTITRKSDASRSSWTAIFRPQTTGADVSTGTTELARFIAGDGRQTSDPGGSEQAVAALQQQLAGAEESLQQARADLESERQRRQEIEQRAGRLEDTLAVFKRQAAELVAPGQGAEPSEQAREDASRLARELAEARSALTASDENLKRETQTCTELGAQLAATRLQLEALNKQLASGSAQENAGERPALLEPHPEFEAELAAARAAAVQAESSLRAEVERTQGLENRLDTLCRNLRDEQSERSKRFEEELIRHRCERDELNEKLIRQREQTESAKRHAEELEQHLVENESSLERVREDLQRSVEERQRSEDEWKHKLAAADAQKAKLKQAWQQAEERAKRFQQEMASLQQDRSTLTSRLDAEQQSAAEIQFRVEELEARLRQNASELESVKKVSDDATKQNRSEMETANLYHVRDILAAKLEIERRIAAESTKRSEDLEEQLRSNSAELERVKQELSRHTQEQNVLKNQLHSQQCEARSAAQQAEQILREIRTECDRLHTDLNGLQQTRDDLKSRLTTAQVNADNAQRSSERYEQQLRERTDELERVRAEQARQIEEQTRIEAEFQAQLAAAKSATERAVAAREEESQRNRDYENRVRALGENLKREHLEVTQRLEGELAALRGTCEELTRNHAAEQQASAEARQQRDAALADARARQEQIERMHQEQASQAQASARLADQLRAAQEAAAKTSATLATQAAQAGEMENKLAESEKARTDLAAQLDAAKQAAEAAAQQIVRLEQQSRASQEEQDRLRNEQAQLTQARTQLADQLQAVQAASEKDAASVKEREEQLAAWERKFDAAEQARADLAAQLETEKQSAAAARTQQDETGRQLQKTRDELHRLRADRGREGQELKRLTAALQAAQAAASQKERALADAVRQASEREQELTRLRPQVGERQEQLTAQKDALTKARRLVKELEKAKRDLGAEVTSLTAALEEQRRARQTLEARGQQEGEGATKAAAQLQAENQRLTEAHATLSAELCQLREGHAWNESELGDSKRQIQENLTRLTRAAADLEKERGERRRMQHRVDSLTEQLQELHGQIEKHLKAELENKIRLRELEQQLRTSEDQLAQSGDELEQERTDRQLIEQQLRTADALSNQMRNCLSSFDVAKQGFKRAQSDLEAKLQLSQNALKEAEAKLQHQLAERARQEEAVAQAHRAGQEEARSAKAELTKIQAELEDERLERKKLEGSMVQSRYATLDSTRAGLAMVNRLRAQVREPVDGVLQETRRLLETELEDEARKSVESVLEHALLLQRTLQAAISLNACSLRDESDPAGDGRGAQPKADQPTGDMQP